METPTNENELIELLSQILDIPYIYIAKLELYKLLDSVSVRKLCAVKEFHRIKKETGDATGIIEIEVAKHFKITTSSLRNYRNELEKWIDFKGNGSGLKI